ncbi:MAG: putative membrane protein SirB2 [Candidatus Pseudothioglobus sp.]|jgi:uncharacterized membrane protein SirB2
MTLYSATYFVHLTCVMLSISFFLVRGVWMLTDSSMLAYKFTKIAPHVIDTLLLGSAITLLFIIGQYPFINHWLTAKLIGLVVYIVLGTIAIKRGKTKGQRSVALVAALITFGYILSVAIRRDPMGFLGS